MVSKCVNPVNHLCSELLLGGWLTDYQNEFPHNCSFFFKRTTWFILENPFLHGSMQSLAWREKWENQLIQNMNSRMDWRETVVFHVRFVGCYSWHSSWCFFPDIFLKPQPFLQFEFQSEDIKVLTYFYNTFYIPDPVWSTLHLLGCGTSGPRAI